MAKISPRGSVPGTTASGGKIGTPTRKNSSRVLSSPTSPSRVQPVTREESITHRLAFWGVLGILFFPAFFSGMFFPPAQEKGLMVAAVIFWLTWLWKYFSRDTAFLAQPLDYLALALPVAAIAAGIWAANYSLALNEVVKYILYFLVFWVVARLITNEHEIYKILHAVYLSAVGVALAGLGSATGLLPLLQDGFVSNRIYSTFQYPNATASYLAAAFILGLYLWHRAKQYQMPREIPALGRLNGYYPYQFLYAVANFILLAALVGTGSYGGILVFVIALVLYFLLLPGGNRTAFAYHFVTVLIAAAPAILLFLHEVAAKKMGLAWLVILAGAILALLFQMGYALLERRRTLSPSREPKPGLSLPQKRILAAAGIVVVLAVVAVAVAQTLLLIKHPDLLAKQPYVTLRARDVIERLYFYLDALIMFVHRPILGWGGGGWQAAYRSFQSYFYDSNQGHSYYLQVLVEMGAVGILLVIGLWYSFLRLTHRLFRAAKENPARQLLILTVTMVAVEIGTHALVDFDLALSALFLVVWAMFGIAWALDKMGSETTLKKERKRSYVPYNHTALISSTAFCAVAVLLGLTLTASNGYAQDAATQYGNSQNSQNQSYQVLADLQKAIEFNPLNPQVNGLPGGTVDGTLATLDLSQGKTTDGVALAQKAVALDPYDAQSYATLANVESNSNQAAAAVQAAEKALSLAPFQQEWYDTLAQMDVMAGIQAISGAKKDSQQARGYFEGSLKVPEQLAARMNSLNPVEQKLWKDGPPLQSTGMINLATGISNYFLGNYAPATQELAAAQGDSSLKDEALLWQSVLAQKTGQTQQSGALLAQVKKDNSSLAADYDTLKAMSLEGNSQPAAKPAK
ncbi:MAG TPA: O-antigen ligase family protein [Spirochaetia bacterium]|nr:O-antigen ligase family protein [Spirochaetia bacterium]